jgi:thioredoxin reductase (NADPH)
MENVVILGTGAAGLTAAIYTARAKLSPLVLEGDLPGGLLTTTSEVENFPGFAHGIDGRALMDAMHAQAERFGARFQYGRVTGADLAGSPLTLTLEDGSTLQTRTLIIATGSSPKYLGLPSEQALLGGGGVTSCATCDGAFYQDMPVAVVGGGDSALEEALFLTRYATTVHLIHRRDAFRASKIMVDRAVAHPKIQIHYHSVVEEVLGVEQRAVSGARLRNVQTGAETVLDIKGFFVAIGHQPNTAPFGDQLDKDAAGYLVTRNSVTNRPGVFACGDVQDSRYRQAITAAGSGCMAALEAEKYLEAQGH